MRSFCTSALLVILLAYATPAPSAHAQEIDEAQIDRVINQGSVKYCPELQKISDPGADDCKKLTDAGDYARASACWDHYTALLGKINKYNAIVDACQGLGNKGSDLSKKLETQKQKAIGADAANQRGREEVEQEATEAAKQEAARQAAQRAAEAEARRIPAGWIVCQCPQKHTHYGGKWVNGVFYHPPSVPHCSQTP